MVDLELFTPTDLRELAQALELQIADESVVVLANTAINQAFSEYANAASIQVNNSPAGERLDWCAGIGKAAADLHGALGHTDQSLFFEPSGFAAAETLEKGWPADPHTAGAGELRDRLMSAFSVAMPDRYVLSVGARSAADVDGDLLILLGRLGPALRALKLVADSAQEAWKAEVARSGNSQERGRRHLMNVLVPAFASLFGRLPAAAPGSAGFRWFSALITQAGRIAAEQRGLAGYDEPREAEARIAALQAVEAIAAHIVPQKTETRGTAKLQHWIRQARASPEVRRTSAISEGRSRIRNKNASRGPKFANDSLGDS